VAKHRAMAAPLRVFLFLKINSSQTHSVELAPRAMLTDDTLCSRVNSRAGRNLVRFTDTIVALRESITSSSHPRLEKRLDLKRFALAKQKDWTTLHPTDQAAVLPYIAAVDPHVIILI
jgi:hypothetical protein